MIDAADVTVKLNRTLWWNTFNWIFWNNHTSFMLPWSLSARLPFLVDSQEKEHHLRFIHFWRLSFKMPPCTIPLKPLVSAPFMTLSETSPTASNNMRARRIGTQAPSRNLMREAEK